MVKEKHLVFFYSPGTLFCEENKCEIDEWDAKKAVQKAKRIVQRHGAVPFGFNFQTILEHDPVSDGRGGTLKVAPKVIKTSGMYFIKGRVLSFDDIRKRNQKDYLAENMLSNNWPLVCETTNGYTHVSTFEKKDLVINENGKILERGNGKKAMTYRRWFQRNLNKLRKRN